MIHLVLLPNVIFLFLNISKGCCGGTIFEEWGHIFKGKTSALAKGKPELEYLLVVSDLGRAAHSFLVFSFKQYLPSLVVFKFDYSHYLSYSVFT